MSQSSALPSSQNQIAAILKPNVPLNQSARIFVQVLQHCHSLSMRCMTELFFASQGLKGAILPSAQLVPILSSAGSSCTSSPGQWINSTLIISLAQNIPAATVCQFSFNIQNPAVGQVSRLLHDASSQ